MHNFYRLSFSKHTLTFVSQFYQASNNVLYGFYENKLYNSQYKSGIWQALYIADICSQSPYFTNISNRNILIAKTKEGIVFYECQHNILKLLSRDGNDYGSGFCNLDGPGNTVKFGHFYSNTSLFGMVAEHKYHEIKCCAVIELRDNEYLIQTFYTALNILDEELFLAELNRKGQENIITYGKKGLNIYKFNYHDRLEHLMQVPHCVKSDDSEEKLFFPSLAGQSYQDIVLLNSSGLFAYQYSNEQNNYSLIHYNSRFAKLKGWNAEHINSTQFADIDLDGRQDMLFTGSQGINLLSFDNYTNQCQHPLGNSQLTAAELHSNVVKVIPDSPPIIEFPTVFPGYKNQLYWANVTEVEKLSKEEIAPQAVGGFISNINITGNATAAT